jgi:SLAP domain-containing protein
MEEKIKLSFIAEEENNISKLALDMYEEELSKLNSIEKGTLGIKTLYIFEHKESIEAKIFIINATDENLNLEKVNFQLLDEYRKIILEEKIDVSSVGVIPTMSARPFSLFFHKNAREFKLNDKCVVFIKQTIEAEQNVMLNMNYVDPQINNYEISMAKDFISTLPPYKKGELKIRFYKTIRDLNGAYSCIVLLINASEQNGSFSDFGISYKNKLGLLCAYKKIENPLISPANGIAVHLIKIEEKDIITFPEDIEDCLATIQVIQR